MAALDTPQIESRARLYNKLRRRNGVVSVLRLAVPAFGCVVLAFLLSDLIVANLAPGFGDLNVRVDKGQVVLDAPTYSGTTADGLRYTIVAEAARTPLDNPDVISIDRGTINLLRPDGYAVDAEALKASFSLMGQTVDVEDSLFIADSNGLTAELENVDIDWQAQTFMANKSVNALFADGTRLEADQLVYSGERKQWIFTNAKITLLEAL